MCFLPYDFSLQKFASEVKESQYKLLLAGLSTPYIRGGGKESK
jgi:hypothetical protein